MTATTTLQTSGTQPKELVTLVTGAGGALGQAVCWQLIRNKHRVVATDLDEQGMGSLKDEASALCFALDATDESHWSKVLSATQSRWGAVGGAVLCAGGWEGGKPFHESDPDIWGRMFRSNLESARVALHVLLRHMLHHRAGSIVAVGSRAVERPWENAGSAAYGAAKAALVHLVQTTAKETLTRGVRVNAVLPSTIDTPNNRKAMPDAEHARWVSTREVTSAIEFLLSDAAGGVTGAALPVYGRL